MVAELIIDSILYMIDYLLIDVLRFFMLPGFVCECQREAQEIGDGIRG
ncbi:hypothetical protein HALO59_170106 [Halomonas sp. 59]|nr:hypothetical protein HALO156_10285 [Halomonas sp. 156]CAD5264817.1 hypothetical protein HALO113_160943 [Halomonas sp. 113]CAD5267155.1 hypothetical protein HALO59_170106 [Halomonas sp. 59]